MLLPTKYILSHSGKKRKVKMRRANGTGSITKIKGNLRKPYLVRVSTATGERKPLGTYKSKKEAERALNDYNMSPYDLDAATLTFKELYEQFHRMKEKMVSKSTLKGYESSFKRCSALHRKKIMDVKTPQLQMFINGLDASVGTKQQTKIFLTSLYGFAIELEYILVNRAKSIKIVKDRDTEIKEATIFTNEEIKKLWENERKMDWIDIVLIMIYTGMRIGEIVGIRKENVDLINGFIRGGNKTEKGRNRIIPIHRDILELIRKRYADSKTDYLVDNRNWIKYKKDTNKPLRTNYLREKFYEVMKNLGMNHLPHDTRKTLATILSKNKISDSIITDTLGHSDIGITEKYYIQNDPDTLKVAINGINIIN